MLTELLDTRVMVKQAMKGVKSDKVCTQVPVFVWISFSSPCGRH